MFRSRMLAAVAVAVAAALTLAACGSSDSSSGGGGATAQSDLDWASSTTAKLFEGTDRPLPSSGPEAVTGKTVWAITCAATAPGCDMPAEGFADAAQHLGWTTKVVDGKLDPTVYNSSIRAAGAAHVDAVALFGVDCSSTEGAIKAVQAEGVKVFGINALDCDDTYSSGGQPLFDGSMKWGPDSSSYGDFLDDQVGPSIAAWVVDTTNGAGNILVMTEDDNATTHHVGDAEVATLKAKCGGCTVNTVPYTGGDLVDGGVQSKLSAALQKYPDAGVVMTPVDATILLGAGAAVEQARASGRTILLVGEEGVPGSIALIKKGDQDFALGRPWTWTGWAAADALNRFFAGDQQVDAGFGFGAMDADHPPTSDVYDGNAKSAGYQANYLKIWGVS
ncbi:sugar ABC transporter substrate-binding protein [Nocardioides mangrovi]|uniref:Substrate-binding domain-containing protein n=1 Tax=Nocardioides mangrovi TaxID=2874580 RepID=A0ABS7UFG5_9ACTN|nr:substrate-binding domain-containing protein [Nocardioides mangrovi]MBZ5739565.1 substrate-binding domain-containing protein [Nocardioides mangrovi]